MKTIRLSEVSASNLSATFEVVKDGILEDSVPITGVKCIRFFSNGSVLLSGKKEMWFCDGKEILSHGDRIEVHLSYPSTFTVYGEGKVSYVFKGKEIVSLDATGAEEILPIDHNTYCVKRGNIYEIYRRGKRIDQVGLVELRKKYMHL